MTRKYRRHRSRKTLVIGLVLSVILIVLGMGMFVYSQRNGELGSIGGLKDKLLSVREWVIDRSKSVNVPRPSDSDKSQDPIQDATQILRIGAMSDSHGADENIAKALAAMQADAVDLVLHLGDFSEGGEAEHFASAKDLLDGSGLPYRVLPGDHDFNWFPDHSRQNYEQVFGKAYDQIFEISGIRIILLENSVNTDSRDDQIAWLKALLDNNQDTITLFFTARPLYSPYFTYKEDELGGDIVKMLVENGVKYAFAGDTHIFAKYKDVEEKLDLITVGAVGEYKNPLPQWVLLRVFDNGYVEVTPRPITDFTDP